MRYESIKKRSAQWVKIRPALQVYDDSAVLLNTVEDAWFISEITDDSLTVQSRDTQHRRTIGPDHIHNYMADPEGQHTHGTTGTLVLNVQLLLYEDALLAEPVAPPGTPLKVFVPARPRASLINAAAKLRAQEDLRKARHEFAWSQAGVKAADHAFVDVETAITKITEELQLSSPSLNVRCSVPI